MADTPTILQGLPADVAQATAPAETPTLNVTQNPAYAPSKPRVPAAAVPARPADQQGEDQEAPDIHPVDAMATAFIGHLLDKDKASQPDQPQPDHAPGSFAAKLAGAAGALGGGLGDMRTGGDPGKGHGWLSAVGATLNARNDRVEKEKQQKFENDERLKSDQINIATANVNLRQHALALQQAEKSIRDAGATTSSQFVDTMRDNYKVQDKISQDQLQDMVSKDPTYLQTHTARITGYEPVYGADGKPKTNADGSAVESPLWSLVDLSPGDVKKQYTVSPTIAKKWSDAGLQSVPAGTMMPATVANKMDVQAERYGTSLGLLNLGKVQPLPDDVKNQMADALKDPEVQHALAMQPGSPLAGLYTAQSNIGDHLIQAQKQLDAAQASGDKNAVQAAQQQVNQLQDVSQKVDKTINNGFTDAERGAYAKQKTDQDKLDEKEAQDKARDLETHRHNVEMEAVDRAKGVDATPDDVAHAGQLLADSMEDPSQLSKRGKSMQKTLNAADDYTWKNYGKGFSPAQQSIDFKYASKAQDTLKYINSLTGGPGVAGGGNLGELVKQSNRINRTEFPALNDAAAWARLQTGDPSIAAYKTVVTEVADQVAKILQGGAGSGGTSDAKLHQAQEMFAQGFTKDQIKAVAAELSPLLQNRQKGMIGNNRYLQHQFYGPGGVTATMVSPDGKQAFEVPISQADAAKSKGARLATPEDYRNGTVKPSVNPGL